MYPNHTMNIPSRPAHTDTRPALLMQEREGSYRTHCTRCPAIVTISSTGYDAMARLSHWLHTPTDAEPWGCAALCPNCYAEMKKER